MAKPTIRFKGYTEDWEQRKLGDVCEIKDSARIPNSEWSESGVPYIRASDVTNENRDGVLFISQERYEFYKNRTGAPTKDDVLFNGGGEIGKSLLIVDENPIYVQGGAVLYACTSESSELVGQYLKIYFETTHAKSYIDAASAGGTMKHFTLKPSQMMPILMPSVDEQEKLGTYFSNLDNLITLHQRKCEETKILKKYMLQKMFPQNGQKVPEIRFKGFTEDWEQRKLDDWGTFYYGRSCPKWSVTEDATIPCIRYGELYTKFGAKIDKVYSYTNMSPENLRFSKGTEVLIPRVGEDPMDYNHCTWLSMPDVAIGEMISVFNTDNNPLFTATMFNATLQNEFAMRVEGGSVTNLYFEKLKNIEVSFPSLNEQERIATYFDSLDHLITLHQRKYEELKNIKKFMLQNMFV